MDCSPLGSSVHEILQARILEWVTVPSSREPTTAAAAAAAAAAAKSLQSCPTLCDPIDGSPPGSTAPRILQARTLEWVAVPSSREPTTAICRIPAVRQVCPIRYFISTVSNSQVMILKITLL